ncbi:Nitroreductase [Sporobacter termitidis DSM 10068]|uniref:Nitroreductase n=1 Tax=Sporobacter termitidis DSM 10068 TaxID=1123282 RepID=A0A1M5YG70_9FIRM|nr:nitroreductase [Sporobacter termitidis]SHI11061.1 Nitroreductase [Sporobacter termitidis DSM 10068]
MTVSQAITSRRSMRAFKPDPISRETLLQILRDASYSPSWANSQPWEVFVAEGEALKRIKAGYADCYAKAVRANTDIPRPAEWTEAAKKRQQGLHPDMVRDCGDAVQQFGALNQRMFDAPAVIFLCKDKILSIPWALYDIGAFSQTLMLSALEHGLGTIPAATSIHYPEVLRRELKLPENLEIVIGIAIGYVDETNAINNFRSARSPIEETVRFCD